MSASGDNVMERECLLAHFIRSRLRVGHFSPWPTSEAFLSMKIRYRNARREVVSENLRPTLQ